MVDISHGGESTDSTDTELSQRGTSGGVLEQHQASVAHLLSHDGMNMPSNPIEARDELNRHFPELSTILSTPMNEEDREMTDFFLLSFFEDISGIPYLFIHESDKVRKLIEKCTTPEYKEIFASLNGFPANANTDSLCVEFLRLFSMGLRTLVGEQIL